MKPITRRLAKLIEKARVVTYSMEELKQLVAILKDYASDDSVKFDYSDIYSSIWDCIALKEGRYPVDRDSDWILGEETNRYEELNFFQFLLVYHQKIFLFLTCVAERNIALYINRDPLKPFVKWRLKISK